MRSSAVLYYLIITIAVFLGIASGMAEPVSFVVIVASGVHWYAIHEWLVAEGSGAYATPMVLLQALGLVLLMATLMGWPWFCAAGACPLMVIGLRNLRQRPPWGRPEAHL